jgi:hypothetical protein
MLCHVNFRMKSTVTRLQMLLNKSMSLIASWAWSYDGSLDFKDLNEAIIKGVKKEQCDLFYNTSNPKICHIFHWQISKVGGLDSRDQSRSRSRMSFMSRLTFLKCRDFLDGGDQLFFSWSRFLKSRFFNQDLAASRFLSRSSRLIETVETYQDCQDFSHLSRYFGF